MFTIKSRLSLSVAVLQTVSRRLTLLCMIRISVLFFYMVCLSIFLLWGVFVIVVIVSSSLVMWGIFDFQYIPLLSFFFDDQLEVLNKKVLVLNRYLPLCFKTKTQRCNSICTSTCGPFHTAYKIYKH